MNKRRRLIAKRTRKARKRYQDLRNAFLGGTNNLVLIDAFKRAEELGLVGPRMLGALIAEKRDAILAAGWNEWGYKA